MKLLRVKNWERFQHYKRRSPPWIKLHRELLNDFAFQSLNDASRSHLMLIWVLAAGTDGTVPANAKFIAARIGASSAIDLDALTGSGLLELIEDGAPEHQPKEKPKRERAKHSPLNGKFEEFYNAYPKKKNRADAERAWLSLSPDETLCARMATAIEAQKQTDDWRRENGKFIPYPASWLNGRRWEDEVKVAVTPANSVPHNFR